jgi:hypothetical protein
LSAGQLGWAGYVGIPLKRVINANYLQPVIVVRRTNSDQSSLRNAYMYPLQLEPVGDTPHVYRAQFTAARSGELYLFANDAALPFKGKWAGKGGLGYFYANNHGSACVIIARVGASFDRPLKTSSPVCRAAADRERQLEQAKTDVGRKRGIIIQ